MCEQANAPRYPWKRLSASSQKFDGGGDSTKGTTSIIVVEPPAYVHKLWKKWKKRIGGTPWGRALDSSVEATRRITERCFRFNEGVRSKLALHAANKNV